MNTGKLVSNESLYQKVIRTRKKISKNAAEVGRSSDLMKILSRKNRLFSGNDPKTRTNRSNKYQPILARCSLDLCAQDKPKLKPTPSRELGHNCPSCEPNFSILKWLCLADGKGLGDNFGTYGLLSTYSIV